MGVRSVSYVPGKLATLATFADLVAIPATGNQGIVYTVTELNNAQFISDGTRWRPVNGQQLIAIKGDIVNPVVTLTMTNFADGTQNVVDTTMSLPSSLTNYYDSSSWNLIVEAMIVRTGVGSGGASLLCPVMMADTLSACQGAALPASAFSLGSMTVANTVDSSSVSVQTSVFQGGCRRLSFPTQSIANGGLSLNKVANGAYVPTTQQKFFFGCRNTTGVVSGDVVVLQRLRISLQV